MTIDVNAIIDKIVGKWNQTTCYQFNLKIVNTIWFKLNIVRYRWQNDLRDISIYRDNDDLPLPDAKILPFWAGVLGRGFDRIIP